MKDLKTQNQEMVSAIFIDKNSLVLFVSWVPMIIAMIRQPAVISVTKFVMVFVASAIYVITTYLLLVNKRDLTFLCWLISIPLVVYCAAGSLEILEWSDAVKNANWLLYLSGYFFLIALLYRGLIVFLKYVRKRRFDIKIK